MNENAVQRVMPDGQRLAVAAQQDLLVGDKAGHPDRVDVDVVHDRPAGPGQARGGDVGRGAEPRRLAGVADHGGGPQRGA